jgi:tetratricopeptide (TPR) repeat protein
LEKLTLSDVKLKTPRQQVKEAILEKYKTTEEFADAIGLYHESVKVYLRDKNIGSDKFKIKLVNALDKGYDEIVIRYKKQISKMVQTVSRNFKDYKSENDLLAMTKLKQLCIEHNLDIESMKIDRAMARYHFYITEFFKSVELLEMALVKARSLEDKSFEVMCLSDLGLMHYSNHKFNQALEIFTRAEKLTELQAIDNDALFDLNYLFGILLNDTGHHEKAREKFSKAIELASDKVDKGRAIMNIGLSYKKQREYQTAIEHYTEALQYTASNGEKQSVVYNNLAELYKVIGDYDSALKYIQRSFELLDYNNQNYYFITFQTYAQIKALKGELDDVLERLFEIIIERRNIFTDKSFMIKGIETVIQLAYQEGNNTILKRIELFLIESLDTIGTDNTEYASELERCLGKILRCYNSKFEI